MKINPRKIKLHSYGVPDGTIAFDGQKYVFEGSGTVCRQQPKNTTLAYLRRAGYVDAWPAIHGASEGYTGMLNRRGCGVPEGYVWKRIDYAWSKKLTPVNIQRFGGVPPGDALPADSGLPATWANRRENKEAPYESFNSP